MIIVNLYGGLGNQMFQYALGRHLAEKNNTELKLDISAFESYKLRKYELGNLNIIEKFALPEEISRLSTLPTGKIERFIRKTLRKPVKKPESYIKENITGGFNPKILDLQNNIYLEGYWQSEKYFIEIEDIIRKEFSFKFPATGKNKEILENILNINSVSLHIRRGDYVTNPEVNQVHGVCSLDYYKSCVDFIEKKLESPYFYIFSDDIEWVKNNLQIQSQVYYVDHNTVDNAIEDMRLMFSCKHNILANSSFSWWGAWLNSNPDKMVITPRKWFNTTYDSNDLIPERWIKL
ncbi:MAG: glycosyl transferase family protein [uncultured bacterium]|nr:MAG: glycosyl transferase family protein [uncultured bacterium]